MPRFDSLQQLHAQVEAQGSDLSAEEARRLGETAAVLGAMEISSAGPAAIRRRLSVPWAAGVPAPVRQSFEAGVERGIESLAARPRLAGRNTSPWRRHLARLRHLDAAGGDRAGLEALLDPGLTPVDPRLEVLDTEDCGSYVRQRVLYDVEDDMSVPAYLLVPSGRTTPGPAVLAAHGHGPGKDEICGVVSTDSPNVDYARQLAEAGFVVLAPDHRGFGERSDPAVADRYQCDVMAVHADLLGESVLGLGVWDMRRSLDVLAGLDVVDPGRMGMVGLSFGGTLTLFTAALDERVAAAVVSGYLSDWPSAASVPWNMCGSQIAPRLGLRYDHVDVGALIAPRPLLVETGRDDPLFPVEAATETVARLRAGAYGGAGERLVHDVFDAGHQWHGTEAIPFLRHWLAGAG